VIDRTYTVLVQYGSRIGTNQDVYYGCKLRKYKDKYTLSNDKVKVVINKIGVSKYE